jgi:hypothetical protein
MLYNIFDPINGINGQYCMVERNTTWAHCEWRLAAFHGSSSNQRGGIQNMALLTGTCVCTRPAPDATLALAAAGEEGYTGNTAAEQFVPYKPTNMTDKVPIREGQTVGSCAS